MRLIDADAFRRELDNHWPFTRDEQSKHGMADMAKSTVLTVLNQMPTIEERRTDSGMATFKEILRAVENLPSAQPEQRWVLCSERLPEESGRYLATRGLKTTGPLWNRVYIVNYSDLMGLKSERIWWDGNVGKSDFRRLEDVIAWMPLPEPYKERREE